MSYQEKRSISSIFATVLIFLGYWLYASHRLQTGTALASDLSFWGLLILIFVPVSIVVRILIEIGLAIANATANAIANAAANAKANAAACGDAAPYIEDPSFTDERDQLIELKSERFSAYVAGFGFLLAMLLLVLKQPAYVMLNTIFLAFNLGAIAESLAKLYYYRRGF
jgi:hypothetical protein